MCACSGSGVMTERRNANSDANCNCNQALIVDCVDKWVKSEAQTTITSFCSCYNNVMHLPLSPKAASLPHVSASSPTLPPWSATSHRLKILYFHVTPLHHLVSTPSNVMIASEFIPVWLPILNLRLRETTHGIAQGTVFMVKVHLLPSSRGSRGDTSVSQRPVPLPE